MNNLLRAGLMGAGIGLIVSASLIDKNQSDLLRSNNEFEFDIEVTRRARQIYIAQEYRDTNNLNGAYVCMFQSRKTERSKPLFTDYLGTCCALVLDNKKEGTHYLGHFSSADDPIQIRASITNNFPNLKEPKDFKRLKPTIIEGLHINSIAAKNVYSALNSLELSRYVRYCRSERVLIKDGRFYDVKW